MPFSHCPSCLAFLLNTILTMPPVLCLKSKSIKASSREGMHVISALNADRISHIIHMYFSGEQQDEINGQSIYQLHAQ